MLITIACQTTSASLRQHRSHVRNAVYHRLTVDCGLLTMDLTFTADLSKFKYLFIAILTILLIMSQYGIFLTRNFSTVSQVVVMFDNVTTTTTVSTTTTTVTPKVYLVLLWTPYFGKYSDWPKFEDLKCKYRNCELTADRTVRNISDAVLFHWRDINLSDVPRDRTANQWWILLNQESPNNSPLNTIVPLSHQINWTMTYRRDSDIYAPYGQFASCDGSDWKPVSEFGAKAKSVAWIVSHCQTHSRREEFVRKLQNYIDVDVYGSCGPHVCQRHPSCLQTIASQYKFYLSFENSLCKDYVTEKLFNVAKYDIVPIVLGGANYSALLPPDSYIDALNFTSPKELAAYLLAVGSDEAKYNAYLKWKQRYCVVNTGWEFFCNMCEQLNNPRNHDKSASLADWWFRDGNCDNNVQY